MELDEAADGVEDDEAHAREELRRIVGHHAAARRIGYQVARARPIPEQHPRRSTRAERAPPARAAMRLGPLRVIGRNREPSCAIGPGFFIAEAAEQLLRAIRQHVDRFVERHQARHRCARRERREHDRRDDEERRGGEPGQDGDRVGLTGRDDQVGRRRLARRERIGQWIAAGQRGGDGERRAWPSLRIALEAAHDDPFDRRIEIADDRRGREGRGSALVQLQQIAQRLRLERAPAREDLEQHEAQRVDVGLDGRRRHGLKAVPYDRSWGKLLGRHVLRRARAHDVGIAGGDSVS